MKKRTATIKCKVYEDNNTAYPRVEVEGDTSPLLIALVAIMKSFMDKDVADEWVLHKLIGYAQQPDDESRKKYMQEFQEEYKTRRLEQIKELWENVKRNHYSGESISNSKEDNK